MELYLTELTDGQNGKRLCLCPMPEKLTLKAGAKFFTYSILALGEALLPSGKDLLTFSLSGTIYGEARKNLGFIQHWEAPEALKEQLRQWCESRRLLRLNITETDINMDVYIRTFQFTYTGGFGDISYTMELSQSVRPAVVVSVNTTQTVKAAPKESTATVYTVVSGDNLWSIALRFYKDSLKWSKIYDANKEVIESTAKKHGRANSSHGHWLWPGEKLVIP